MLQSWVEGLSKQSFFFFTLQISYRCFPLAQHNQKLEGKGTSWPVCEGQPPGLVGEWKVDVKRQMQNIQYTVKIQESDF